MKYFIAFISVALSYSAYAQPQNTTCQSTAMSIAEEVAKRNNDSSNISCDSFTEKNREETPSGDNVEYIIDCFEIGDDNKPSKIDSLSVQIIETGTGCYITNIQALKAP